MFVVFLEFIRPPFIGKQVLVGGLQQFFEAGVFRKTYHVVDFGLGFDPGEKLIPAKATVGAQDDACLFPKAFPDLGNDELEGFKGAFCSVDIGFAEFGPKWDVPAKCIEREVAIVAIVAVIKGSFLLAVKRVVGGIEVDDDGPAFAGDALDSFFDEEIAKLFGMGLDLLLLVDFVAAKFESIEGAFSGQSFAFVLIVKALPTQKVVPSASGGEDGVMPELVLVVEVFISERKAMDPLAEKLWQRMLDESLVAMVREAFAQALAETEFLIDLAKK